METETTDTKTVDETVARIHFSELPNNTDPCWWKDPYDGSLLNGLESMDHWKAFLNYPAGYRLGGITACLFVPAILFSWIADTIAGCWGRHAAVYSGTVIIIVGSVINAAAINLAMYCSGRALTGVGISMCLATGPTLLQEIAHPRYRSKISGFYIASITSSWICFGCLYINSHYSWRIPCYLQLLGPIFVLIATTGCPESPRWLVSKGRKEEASQILAKYHANGDLNDPLIQYELHEIEIALGLEQLSGEVSFMDFTKTKANRHRLLILIVVGVGTNWVGNGIINYYLTPTLNQVGIYSSAKIDGINAGLQMWNLIVSTCAALLMERLGRRFLWLFSDCGMLFSYIFAMALSGKHATSGESSYGLAVIPFLFLFFGAYDVAWTPLQFAYPVEILPFSMRMKGMVLFVMVQNIAVTVNTFVNPIAMDAIGWKYYGVYIAILALYIVITYFYFPETRRMTIEEISDIFEGSNQPQRTFKHSDVETGKKTQAQSPHSSHVEHA
ncbi:hypothetical protein N7528_002101 [Penicillium herquei]|nr:hypothetical protein N7528_002101 [Penicillium herquei]